MKGKNFTSAKGDDNVYTPYSMTEQLLENEEFDYKKTVLEPCFGNGAICRVLNNYGMDYYSTSALDYDFLQEVNKYNYIITNPPYSQLDKFIKKAKETATDKFAFLCKLTHLGGIDRLNNNVFKDENYPLTKVYLFVRQANLRFNTKYNPDYIELREDGKYPAGMYYYCFLIFSKNNNNLLYPTFHWINNQKYILHKGD
jgi:hypothetical protein